jgi:hypothetical protein
VFICAHGSSLIPEHPQKNKINCLPPGSLLHKKTTVFSELKAKYSNTFISRQFIWKPGDLIKGRTH